jgi:nitrogen fixation protein FixH
VLLLGSMLLGLGTMAYIAVDDPGFALEPNYYDKAVHWDRAQAEAKSSRELGWQLVLTKPLLTAKDGSVELELGVTDRSGAAVSGASVALEAFPNAFASRVQQLSLHETAPGRYRASLRHGTAGLWELRFAVQRGQVSYRHVMREDVGKGGSA